MADPIRTCVVCGEKTAKKNLYRYIWRENCPQIDVHGGEPGRGAYCCKEKSCAEKFVTQKKKWKRVFRL